MNSQLPKRFVKEENEIMKKYLDDDEADLETIIKKYASKDYQEYFENKKKRDKELLDKGIIEN